MQFILSDTDIFDTEILIKTKKILQNHVEINKSNVYEVSVIYDVNSNKDDRVVNFYDEYLLEEDQVKVETQKDMIYKLLEYQLEQVDKAFEENEIEVQKLNIVGRDIEGRDGICITIKEIEVAYVNVKGKKKKPLKVRSIMPNEEFIQKTMGEYLSKKYSEEFYKLLNAIGSKKIFAEILEISETEDESKLYKTYVDNYANFWATAEEQKLLNEKFMDRVKYVYKKHYGEE